MTIPIRLEPLGLEGTYRRTSVQDPTLGSGLELPEGLPVLQWKELCTVFYPFVFVWPSAEAWFEATNNLEMLQFLKRGPL